MDTKGVVMLFVALLSAAVFAAAQEISLQAGDQILVRGVNASLTVSAQNGGNTLKVNGAAEAGWNWERREKTLILTSAELSSRRDIESALRDKSRPTIEISGPSVPMEIHLRDGSVTLNKGQHEARVDLRNGKLIAQGRSGALKANLLKGDVNVIDSTGRVDLDLYQGNVNIRGLNAECEVQSHSATVVLDQSQGHCIMNLTQNTLKVSKFSGTLVLDLAKASMTGTALSGRVEGQTGEGNVSLALAGEGDVNLKSQSGRVNVSLPAQSGASLNLVATEGEIAVPAELKVARGSLEKSVRGRLRGEGGKFSVWVRSQEGSIVVK